MTEQLAYIGKVIDFAPIEMADFLHTATVVCGSGGKWRGVVRKEDFKVGDLCVVYLPDSVLPESFEYKFLESSGWRVKMRRFRGAPSEVLIMPLSPEIKAWEVGKDVTQHFKVTKYVKEISPTQAGKIEGPFPQFIPKTDEPNWQRSPELIEALRGHPYYIAEKADGTSATAFRNRGHFGVCSRNYQLKREGGDVYWEMCRKYSLEEKLPEGFAVQFEIIGPGIQKNPYLISTPRGLAFQVFNIEKQTYLPLKEYLSFITKIGMDRCSILEEGASFEHTDLTSLARGIYTSGKPREGIVIRSKEPINGQIISFKAINLDYET